MSPYISAIMKAGPDSILHLDYNFHHFVMLCHKCFCKNRLFQLWKCSYLCYCFGFLGLILFFNFLRKNGENDQKKSQVFF